MPRKKMETKKEEVKSEPIEIKAPVLERQTTNAPMVGSVKKNDWIDHVKATAEKNGISYREALSVAKETYKKN